MTDTAIVLVEAPNGPLPPGLYAAQGSDPAYGWLDAMVSSGTARYVGERYEPDGQKILCVEVPPWGSAGRHHEPNAAGQVRIGREFFTTALRDYHDWREKWWREAIQNAVDAGATEITCTVEQTDDGFAISCADNGKGMDEDTLLNKFLVLGGTTKTTGLGTRGGFGKAKELLILPWLAWRIHSRDRMIVGSGIEYQVESASYRSGTEVRVVMPADQTTHESGALAFIGKCYLPGIRFIVNGKDVRANLATGEAIRDFDGKATLYYDKKATFANAMLVRTMGLYMFESYVSDAVEGTLIVELTGPSIELLTANRDGIRDMALKRELEQFVNQLSADVKSALRKKKGLIREKFKGTGKFTGASEADVRAAMMDHLEEMVPAARAAGGKMVLSEAQTSVLANVLATLGGGVTETDDGEQGQPRGAPLDSVEFNFRATSELASAMLDDTELPGTDAIEAAVRQLAWEPDFFLVNEVEGFKVPKQFHPATMTPGVRKLVRFWAELCRFVMIQLGCREPFGVGLAFDRDYAAEYINEDGSWLMLNPFRKPREIGYEKAPKKDDLWSTSADADMQWLYALAVHECTHMADGISYHDESFASALTRNFARTSGKERQIKAIRKAITARGPRGATEGRTRSAPKAKRFPELMDEYLLRDRIKRSQAVDARYAVFKDSEEYRWDSSDDDLDMVVAKYLDDAVIEIREGGPKGGAVVWRSARFNLLTKGQGSPAAFPALPELSDSWIRSDRQSESRRSRGTTAAFVSFRNSSVSVYDSSRTLPELRKRATEEHDSDSYNFFEIRETATGKPVWRTPGFELDLESKGS